MNHPRHTVVVGCLIRNNRDDVLLIRHPKRGWEIPQGRVEEGENLIDAAHREVLEETGGTVELGPLAAIWSKLTPPPAVIFNFLATWRGDPLASSEESPELGWFSVNEALGLVSHPVNLDRLKALLSFDGEVIYRAYKPNPYQVHGQALLSSK